MHITTDLKKLYHLHEDANKRYTETHALGQRHNDGDFVFETYNSMYNKSKLMSSALSGLGMKSESRIGIFGSNCVEWQIVSHACSRMSFECVCLHQGLYTNEIEYIIEHSSIDVLFVDEKSMITLMSCVESISRTISTIVFLGENVSPFALDNIYLHGMKVYSWDDFIALGDKGEVIPCPPDEEDICYISYERIKGNKLKCFCVRHGDIIKSIFSFFRCIHDFYDITITTSDTTLAYLPLGNIVQKVIEEVILWCGGSIGYWQGDVSLLMDDIQKLRPSIFVGNSPLFENIKIKVDHNLMKTNSFSRCVFEFGFKNKLYWLNRGCDDKNASKLFDKLFFNKIKEKLGSNIRLIVVGDSLLSKKMENFIRVVLSSYIIHGIENDTLSNELKIE